MLILKNKLPKILEINKWYYPEIVLNIENKENVINELNIKALNIINNKVIENDKVVFIIMNIEETEKNWLDANYIKYKFKIITNNHVNIKNIYLNFLTNNFNLLIGSFNIFNKKDIHDTLESEICNMNIYKIYKIDNKNIVIKELFDPFYYGKIWDASLVLLDYIKKILLSNNLQFFKEKNIIDISGGTGFLGIYLGVLLKKYNAMITISEHDDKIGLLNDNYFLNMNLIKENVKIKKLIWGEDNEIYKNKYEIILATDLVYDYRNYNELIFTLKKIYKNNSLIFISYKKRNPFNENLFLTNLKKHFTIIKIHYKNKHDVFIYKLKKY